MKKRNGFFYTLTALLISCGHHNQQNSITYKDKESYYSMNAHFNKNKTRAVEHYMNEKIGRRNNRSFLHSKTDALITLEDGTKFHLEKWDGHIEIKLNKNENSNNSYYLIKDLCQGMKNVITQ